MRYLMTVLLLLTTSPLWAHPGHGESTVGFMAGLIHPLTGVDHLLAMLAVGIWSATTAQRVWLAPLSFAVMLLVGAVLAQAGLVLPAVEPVIVVSVLLLGLLVMVRRRFPDGAVAALVAGFALFHGVAHGQELAAPLALVGMVLATALLHGCGLAVGLLLKLHSVWWQRTVGAGIALAGVGLATGLLLPV